MTTLERANLLVHELRLGRDQLRPVIIQIVGDLIHDLANAQQRCIALEYQLIQLRASVVDAMSSAGPADDRFAAEAAARHRADCHDPGCACRDV